MKILELVRESEKLAQKRRSIIAIICLCNTRARARVGQEASHGMDEYAYTKVACTHCC